MKKRIIKQGDIYICDLFDSLYHEQKGIRPCLVISVDIRNDNSNNIFIFPITHANKKFQPCHFVLRKTDYPFFAYDKNIVLCEEGRSISKKRLGKYLGTISSKDILKILKCKEYVFIEKK